MGTENGNGKAGAADPPQIDGVKALLNAATRVVEIQAQAEKPNGEGIPDAVVSPREVLRRMRDAIQAEDEKLSAVAKVEAVPASVLLSEPEEQRSAHFTGRFFRPAFGASCGEPRTGKGTGLLWIAFCLSLGLPLGPGLECLQRAPAVFFTNEDTRRRLRQRVRAMALGAKVPFENLRDLHVIAKPDPSIHLPENLDALKRTLDPIGPKFIVIDGLSRISIGRDLNSDAEMQPVVEAVESLRDHFEASVELIAHTTKTPGRKGLYAVKGAGCVPAAADHLLMFEREGDVSTLTFSNSRDDDDWTMTLREQQEGDGLVYVPDAAAPVDLRGIVGPTKASRKSTQDLIAETVIRVAAEQKAGLSYEQIGGLLNLRAETVRAHVRNLAAPGVDRLRVIEGGGKGRPTLVYPPEVPK